MFSQRRLVDDGGISTTPLNACARIANDENLTSRWNTPPPGKGGSAKKGDAAGAKDEVTCGGAAGARRANVNELKGLVEVRAACQAARAGAAAVTGEGRPLLQVNKRRCSF